MSTVIVSSIDGVARDRAAVCLAEIAAAAWRMVPPPRQGEGRAATIGLHDALTEPHAAGGHSLDDDLAALGLRLREVEGEDVRISGQRVSVHGRPVTAGGVERAVHLRVRPAEGAPRLHVVVAERWRTLGHEEDIAGHAIATGENLAALQDDIARALAHGILHLDDSDQLDRAEEERAAVIEKWTDDLQDSVGDRDEH